MKASEAVDSWRAWSHLPSADAALSLLVDPIRRWFADRFASPTLAQRLAWPAIAAGEHLLLSAPTGSGKTLAAVLPVFSELRRTPHTSALRCLYIAPLRALCNDLAANLHQCVAEFDSPAARQWIGLRTGDTDSRTRRRLYRSPPEILITTPESLALLLSHPEAGRLFNALRWIIVDEVHSLAGNKRGADLAISLERVAALAREPQRIGLSATCAPLGEAAAWLGGVGREVRIAVVPDRTPLQIQFEHLDDERGPVVPLLDRLVPLVEKSGTTLIFTDSRGGAERLIWAFRRCQPSWANQVALHHASLSAETRRRVEHALKAGALRVVISSTSLEQGIDIGSVDQVILTHPPGGAVRLLQRLGRSGHGPGRLRRGVIFTRTIEELQEAAAIAAAGQVAQLEPLTVPEHPLDVLSQQLVGMAVQRDWTAAEAWSLIRRAYPFRDLPLGDFADCLQYLSGGGAVEVPARLRWQDSVFRIADRRTAIIYRLNVGTILTTDDREVRHEDGTPLGSVGEDFADHLQPGDRFLLNGRCLELVTAGLDALRVREVVGWPIFTRWEGGTWTLSQAVADRLWCLRVRAKEAMLEGERALHALLKEEYGLPRAAAERLADYFARQEAVSEIPGRELLVEIAPSPQGDALWHCLHLPLNAAACEAVGRVLAWRLRDLASFRVVTGWLGFALVGPPELELMARDLTDRLAPDGFVNDLDRAVADSPALGRQFAEAATTGLMLLRNPLGPRRRVGGRDWAARRLFHWLRFADPEFPLLRQARREVCTEVFAADVAIGYLRRLQDMPIHVRRLPALSPFAETWYRGEPTPVAGSLEEVLLRLHAASA